VAYLLGDSGRPKTDKVLQNASANTASRVTLHARHRDRHIISRGNIHALLQGLFVGHVFILIPNHALLSPVGVMPFDFAML
jgi:hypothetical protein